MNPSSPVSPQTSRPEQAAACWFAEEVRPHEPALRDWLHARFPSLRDVDDLVQETYVRLLKAYQSRKVVEARPYMFVLARNAAVDVVRRNQIIAFETLGENERLSVVEDRPSAADTVSHAEELDLLHEAIAALPTRCREVLTLRKLQGFSYREIAQQLGVSENTVDAHMCAGIFRCREYMRAKGVSRERLQHVKEPPA
ncbi:MAG: RNA polymerase sigma factor [Opitutaceae bacterium]